MPRTRRLGLAIAAVPLVAALSGCSVVAAFTPHVEPAIYDTAKELQSSSNASLGSMTFVPDDAKVIRIDYDTQTDEAIMTYTSPTLLRPDVCKGAAATPKPTIQDSWWPVSGVPAEGSACPGKWVAFAIGQQVYAIRPATK
ncbi:hypothetical protein KNO15_21050 [Leifsonia shinshuensis]|uniref:hypothetical protein n=1 Tax=Leifsonia shinshuensis TaxID=150026 RepID=UPI001F51459C|nr:hypothetical protein [Leifsonia shinshuensis]MCI0159197.1 hypothetical protein [Leifsonia shinshuensis]